MDNPNDKTTTLATVVQSTDMLWDAAGFAHGQRVAQMFAASQLVPAHLRGKIADVTIALLMARRLGEDPLTVMQSIYIVSGKAGWSAQYMIARANRSGVFRGRINWRITGAHDDLVVSAYAILADTGEEVSIAASMAMARAEGWTSNKKYTSMPEVMLRYRSATLLIRMYAADVMLGLPTVEEVETMPVSDGVEVIQAPPRGRAALGLGTQRPVPTPAQSDAFAATMQAAAEAGREAVDAAPTVEDPATVATAAQAAPVVTEADDEPAGGNTRSPKNYRPKLLALGWSSDNIDWMDAECRRWTIANGATPATHHVTPHHSIAPND